METNHTYIHYLEDILQSQKRILEYTQDVHFEGFRSNPMLLDAVLRNFELIAYCCNQIPKDIKDRFEDLPWQNMVDLADKIRTEYFELNYEHLWRTITSYLSCNMKEIEEMICILKDEESTEL